MVDQHARESQDGRLVASRRTAAEGGREEYDDQGAASGQGGRSDDPALRRRLAVCRTHRSHPYLQPARCFPRSLLPSRALATAHLMRDRAAPQAVARWPTGTAHEWHARGSVWVAVFLRHI